MVKTVNFVDKENVALVEVGENSREVARFFYRRTGRYLYLHAHFRRDDVRERSFTKPRRTVKQDVIERFAAKFGGLHEHRKICFRFLLTDVTFHRLRAENVLHLVVFRFCADNQAFFFVKHYYLPIL